MNKMRPTIILWLIIAASPARLLYAQASPESITVMLGENNAPFSFVLPNGRPAGLYVDFWKLWSVTNNVPVNLALAPLEQAVQAVKNNEAVFGGVFISEQREAWGDFSIAIHSVKTGLLYNRSTSKAENQLLSGNARVAVFDVLLLNLLLGADRVFS